MSLWFLLVDSGQICSPSDRHNSFPEQLVAPNRLLLIPAPVDVCQLGQIGFPEQLLPPQGVPA